MDEEHGFRDAYPDAIVGLCTRPDNRERIVIVRRADGLFSAHKQFSGLAGAWEDIGPALGLYDCAVAAMAEARERVWWLRAMIEARITAARGFLHCA